VVIDSRDRILIYQNKEAIVSDKIMYNEMEVKDGITKKSH